MGDIFGMSGSSAGGAASGAAAGSIAGPIGTVAGALIGAAGSYFSGKSAQDYAMYSQKHRYRWMVNDLQKAGLNPMLAVGQSPGSPPQPDYPDIGEGALKGVQAVQSARLLASQIQQSQEATNLARAQGNKTIAEGQSQEMDNLIKSTSPQYQSALQQRGDFGEIKGVSAAQQERWDAELTQLKAQGQKTLADLENTKLANDLQRGEISLQQVKLKYADQLAEIQAAYNQAVRRAAEMGLSESAATEAFFNTTGEWGKLGMLLRQLIRR